MYYAFIRRPMINTKGEDTSILFGFMKFLLELIRKESPTHIGVAFDPPGKTFRHEAFEAYKANRGATPELVKAALNPLIELVQSLNIPILMVPGFEADDVIGSAAKKGERNGYEVYMVSPDKDFGQLVSDHIFQFKPGKSGAENELIGKKEICEKFNIQDPIQVIDILALWGDAADNVPGVRGVGEVSARKLVSQYGCIDNILKHLDELPRKQEEAFKEAESRLDMSRFLVTIKTDIELNFTEEDLRVEICNSERCRELFSKYEFNSLLQLLPSVSCTSEEIAPQSNTALSHHKVSFSEISASATEHGEVGIKIAEGILYLSSSGAIYSTSDFKEAVPLLEEEKIKKIGYDLKGYINILRAQNIALKGYLADIELMHYIINPERTHRLDILSQSYLGIDVTSALENNNRPEPVVEPDLFTPEEEISSTNRDDSRKIAETIVLEPLFSKVEKELKKDTSLIELYELIEMPLIGVLADMEYEGFKIDTSMLSEYKKDLMVQMETIESRIREIAAEPELNISSPKQLGVVLFEKLKLSSKIKMNSRNSYPTDEETLLSIKDKSPIIDDILEFRALKKIISTYIEPFPLLINPRTGKIHTTFNQALTSTGRLSSVRPNLQNIPIRTDLGREIRKAFIPSTEGGFIVSSDYSQIELRLMACMSGDKGMIEDFSHHKDIHTATAAKVFKVSEAEVTTEQRRKAKMVNFGIIYGISPFGLSQRLRVPRGEAKEIIEEYFKNYPGIRDYIEKMKEQGRKQGFVETLCRRKRYLPDINSKNQVVRSLAERNAVNAPIQGSAADIIKIAMINVSRRIKKEGLKSRMILQIHDELIIDTVREEKEIVMTLLKEEMENVLSLPVPLEAECSFGKNWLEAH
jgi:DNA polymerase I